MKKILIGLLVVGSMNTFAGVGSTTDFLLTTTVGYEHGCKAQDESDDKLRHIACSLGESLKKAGIKKRQFNVIIESAAENLPDYKSICQ